MATISVISPQISHNVYHHYHQYHKDSYTRDIQLFATYAKSYIKLENVKPTYTKQDNAESTTRCHGINCNSYKTTKSFNGFFCNKHKQRLIIIRSMIRRYKEKDIVMELHCRKLESKVRHSDYGHLKCIHILEKRIRRRSCPF